MTATELPDDAVRRSVDVDLPEEDVWDLVVDDDQRADWFGGPTTLDPVPGGDGEFTDPDGTRRHATVETIDPGRRLSWIWQAEGDDRASRVEVELAPIPGGTRVSVTETPLVPVAGAGGSAFALAA